MSITTAIILAGGLGTRLRPILSDQPKVLAPAAGKPFLHYVFTYLTSQGIQEAILSVGYLADQVKSYAGTGSSWGLKVRYIQEKTPLGTGGAARLAGTGLQEPFLVLNGDTLFLIELFSLEKVHRQTGALATMCLRHMQDVEVRGRVEIDAEGIIRNFYEKPLNHGASLANGGVYLFRPGVLETLPENQPVSLEKDLFPQLARSGSLGGFIQDAYFCDIGTPNSLAAFENDIQCGKLAF